LASKRLQRRPGGRTPKSRRLKSPSDTKDSACSRENEGPAHPRAPRALSQPPPSQAEGEECGDVVSVAVVALTVVDVACGPSTHASAADRERTNGRRATMRPELGSVAVRPANGREDPARPELRHGSTGAHELHRARVAGQLADGGSRGEAHVSPVACSTTPGAAPPQGLPLELCRDHEEGRRLLASPPPRCAPALRGRARQKRETRRRGY
jgi:hypothetical protein